MIKSMKTNREINRLKTYNHKIKNPTIRRMMLKTISLFRPNFDFKDRIGLLKKVPKNSVCAEIGVYTGENSLNILKIVKPKELILIDPWIHDKEMLKKNFADEEGNYQQDYDARYEFTKQRMKDKKNVKIMREKSQEALKKFPDDYFDWIYIDGDHSFDAVLEDLKTSFHKVKPSGYITGDDYQVGKNANRTQQNVAKAVKLFVENYPVKFIEGKNIQFIIQKE